MRGLGKTAAAGAAPAGSWDEMADALLVALELPAADRAGWLAEACRGRPELRREVEALLAAHEDPRPLAVEERLLAAGARAGVLAGIAGEQGERPDRCGEPVGPYRLIRLLGRGGMGEVYLAERADGAYRSRVAVKFLAGTGTGLDGGGGGESARRLCRERQILASLRHPGIASLYDGGVTADGEPYLVMEHVDGQPIHDFCAERRLAVRERLLLFAQVCDAVQYAHVRLVVHRDLKPSNLLVTADGTAKLLDFGIAKLLESAGGGPLAGEEPTRSEVRVFTPRRAAPEQVRGEPVSTATDVYALGVLLYELLTGRLPFAAGDGEADDGPAASTAPGAPAEPPRLRRELRGDLEGILAKALARRPEERYAAAGLLAEDVRRYLAGEPVRARRQTWAYRCRKFVRRHAVPVAALALAGLALAAAALVAAGQARRAARERDRAIAGEQQAKAAMDSLVDLLGMVEPEAEGGGVGGPAGDRVAVADLLARAERRALAVGEPEVAARLLYVLGRIRRQRTDFRGAARLLAAARVRRPADEDLAAEIDFELGLALRALGEKERARELLAGVLASRRARHGARHPDVFVTRMELAQSEPSGVALPRLERLLAEERTALPPGSLARAATLNALGAACFQTGDRRAARRHFAAAAAELAATGPAGEPFALGVLANLAVTLDDPRRQEEVHRRRIAAAGGLYGRRSVVVATALTNLGVALAWQGRHGEAEAAFRQSHEIYVARLGPSHGLTVSALRNVGRSRQLQGDYPEALALLRRAVASARADRGSERGTACLRSQAARVAWLVERSPAALAELRAAARVLIARSAVPADPYPADALMALGLSLFEAGRPREAAEVFADALGRRRAAGGPGGRQEGERDAELSARCALLLARQATGAPAASRDLRACARDLPGWGLADRELVARFAPWR